MIWRFSLVALLLAALSGCGNPTPTAQPPTVAITPTILASSPIPTFTPTRVLPSQIPTFTPTVMRISEPYCVENVPNTTQYEATAQEVKISITISNCGVNPWENTRAIRVSGTTVFPTPLDTIPFTKSGEQRRLTLRGKKPKVGFYEATYTISGPLGTSQSFFTVNFEIKP